MAQQLFFIADNGVSGREPYVTDGTTITSLGDINPGEAHSNTSGSNLGKAVSFGNSVIFTADNGLIGEEFWITDGTPDGTRLLVDFYAGELEPDIRNPVVINDQIWWTGGTLDTGDEPHVSDGTAFGTRIVSDIVIGEGDSGAAFYTGLGDAVLFTVGVASHRGLWVSDGTDTGTRLIAANIFASLDASAELNGVLYFPAGASPSSDGNGTELWRTDGTEAGTFEVIDIDPTRSTSSPNSSFPSNITNLDGTLIFSASDDVFGDELWASDGTRAGTRMIADINPDRSNSNASDFGVVGGVAVFSAHDGDDRKLFATDGTSAWQIATPDVDSFPNFQPIENGARLIFEARDGIWVTDGTSAGTQLLIPLDNHEEILPVGDLIYFVHDDGVHGDELWVWDGTEARMVEDLTPGPDGTRFEDLTVLNTGPETTISGTPGDDLIEPTAEPEVIDLAGGGSDTIQAVPSDLNGDVVINMDVQQNAAAWRLLNVLFTRDDPSTADPFLLIGLVASGSLRIDADQDGTYEVEVTLEGDFSEVDLQATAEGNNTLLTFVPQSSTPVSDSGTPGDDLTNGAAGDDTLSGGAGNDTLNGNAGADSLRGGIGFDTINGGSGNDTLVGQDGYDSLSGGTGDDLLTGNNGFDTLRGGDGNDTLSGGLGLDSLYGEGGDDSLDGNAGFDLLEGGVGNDTLNGNSGADTLRGDDGRDTLNGGINNDLLEGGADADTLSGSNGADSLDGGDGNDILNGNSGADTLNGGAGDDILRGGIGIDTFVFGEGNDVVIDFQNNFDQILIDADLLSETNPVPDDLRSYASVNEDGNLVLDFGGGNSITFNNTGTTTAILDDVSFF